MIKSFLVLSILTCATSMAHADVFDDRQNANEQRANQTSVQKIKSAAMTMRRDFVHNLYAFAKVNSGFAQQPNCFESSYSANDNVLDSSSWYQGTHQETIAGHTITVSGEGSGLFGSSSEENDPMYQEILFRSNAISSCKVVLRNGLACDVSNQYWGAPNTPRFGGECLDASGRSTNHYVRISK